MSLFLRSELYHKLWPAVRSTWPPVKRPDFVIGEMMSFSWRISHSHFQPDGVQYPQMHQDESLRDIGDEA
jgi:hypothetical protein